MRPRYFRRKKVKKIEAMTPEERKALLTRIRRAEDRHRREVRETVADARRRGVLLGMLKEHQLSEAVLHDRSQKAYQRALKYDPEAVFLDYELIMVERPNKCPECQLPMDDEHLLSITHIVSLERGGRHAVDNIEVMHTTCHRKEVAERIRNRSRYRIGDAPIKNAEWIKWSKAQEEKTKEKKLTKEEKEELEYQERRARIFGADWTK